MKQKRLKRAGAKHDGPCEQVVFPSDRRYTKCNICGTERYYPEGFRGELQWIRQPNKKR